MTIPIKLYPKPAFEGTKVLDGESYRIKVVWNTYTQIYYMTLTGVSNPVVIRNIALIVGRELITMHGWGQYLGEMWLVDNSGLEEDPTFEGLGDRWTLEYSPK